MAACCILPTYCIFTIFLFLFFFFNFFVYFFLFFVFVLLSFCFYFIYFFFFSLRSVTACLPPFPSPPPVCSTNQVVALQLMDNDVIIG